MGGDKIYKWAGASVYDDEDWCEDESDFDYEKHCSEIFRMIEEWEAKCVVDYTEPYRYSS